MHNFLLCAVEKNRYVLGVFSGEILGGDLMSSEFGMVLSGIGFYKAPAE